MNTPSKILKKGDSVAVLSPSSTIKDDPGSMDLCNKGKQILEQLDLTVVYGKNAFGKALYKSGTVAERLSDLEEAYKDPKIQAIFCTQGGDNSNELLTDINWEVIKKNPKKFFGSSDITVLLNAIYAHTGQVTYHGIDLMWGLGKNATGYTTENLRKILFSDTVDFARHPQYPEWKVIRFGSGEGICLGGTLPSFCLLLGTDSDPIRAVDAPFVLVIESIGESFARIESYIAQIFQQPNFKKYCKGIIIGYFFLSQESLPENNRAVSEIVLSYAKNLDFPIVEIKELGHAVENIIFPIGGKIRVKAQGSKVQIDCTETA